MLAPLTKESGKNRISDSFWSLGTAYRGASKSTNELRCPSICFSNAPFTDQGLGLFLLMAHEEVMALNSPEY